MIRLTKQQREAVKYPGSAFIEACPGSGKTRILTAKLLHLLDAVRTTPRKIACVTYTNAAVHEIENRVHRYESNNDDASYEVSTIHSFCLTNILSPYYWKLPQYQSGYEILPSDSDAYDEIAREICTRHGLNFNSVTKKAFEQLGRRIDGSPIAQYPLDTKRHAITDFWDELECRGYVDFINIIYFSLRLVSCHSEIAKSVASKFAWILVDEFQDTTALQFQVLEEIDVFKITKFFLVGDSNQSIFRFAGATPERMFNFSNRVQANPNFTISDNWRSSTNIIKKAELLIPRSPSMNAVGEHRDFGFVPSRRHLQSPYEGIVQHFLPLLKQYDIAYGDAAILAPWWITLYNLGRQLSADGIRIVGPGARPYRRSKYLFIRFVERVCEYLETRETYLIQILERELFFFVRDLTGNADFRLFSYWGRRMLICILRQIRCDTKLEDAATKWLPTVVKTIAQTLIQEQLIGSDHSKLLTQSVREMTKEIIKNTDDKLLVRDMALLASYSKNMKLLTLHGSKGREFDAVALIDLHEGRIPHFSIKYQSHEMQEEMREESKRLLYVGMTRAKKILMYFTDDVDHKNPPSKLLANL